jgi:hypothetical protein
MAVICDLVVVVAVVAVAVVVVVVAVVVVAAGRPRSRKAVNQRLSPMTAGWMPAGWS